MAGPPPRAVHPGGRQVPSSFRLHPHRTLAAACTTVVLAASLVRRFPPETSRFYPRCPFHSYTGLLCPGCGSTRALAALLHGHLAEALRLNVLTTLLLPAVLFYGLLLYTRAVRYPGRHFPPFPPAAIAALCGITFAFTLLRNLL